MCSFHCPRTGLCPNKAIFDYGFYKALANDPGYHRKKDATE